MKCLRNNSSNWLFNSLSSIGDMSYGVAEIEVVVGTRLIENSTSLFGGIKVTSLGKTSGKLQYRDSCNIQTFARFLSDNQDNGPFLLK